MPITQTRMLALIQAGEDLIAQREALIKFASEQAATLDEDPWSKEGAAFSALYKAIFAFIPKTETMVTLAKERTWYNLTRGRNAQHATAQRRRRAALRGDTAWDSVDLGELFNEGKEQSE